MVAASLLATMAFQAVVSPPGGLFQSSDTVISESEVQNDLSSFFSFIGNSESSSSSNYNDFAPAPAVAQDTKTINCTIGKSVMSYYKPPYHSAVDKRFAAKPEILYVHYDDRDVGGHHWDGDDSQSGQMGVQSNESIEEKAAVHHEFKFYG
nr:ankyrin repeat-containing protein NPR4-like [Ipomoea batatas]GMD92415.1 ankyrin repeat-containing protein NPR4-like [Ipomoea batatas]